ncbi:FG-nucleoporin [Martiniozyma asiatica (nom. inval.)]|nr:FG-nucleoporin [Martiniozyma asiatica]
MVYDAAPEIELETFGYQAKTAINVSPPVEDSQLALLKGGSVNLLEILYSKKLLVAIYAGKLNVLKLDKISKALEDPATDQSKALDGLVESQFDLNEEITHISTGFGESSLYLVDILGNVKKISVLELLAGKLQVDAVFTLGAPISKITTARNSNIGLALTNDARLQLLFKQPQPTPTLNNVSAFALLQNGQCAVAYNNDASKIDFFKLDSFDNPLTSINIELSENISTIYDLKELSDNSLLAIAGDNILPDEDSTYVSYFIDLNNIIITESELIFGPFSGYERFGCFYSASINGWSKTFPNITIGIGSKSGDIDTFTPNGIFTLMNDQDRATMPMGGDVDDTALGLVVDLTSTQEVLEPCTGLDKCNALPRIYILTNLGQIICWNIWSKKDIIDGNLDLQGALKSLTNFSSVSEPNESVKNETSYTGILQPGADTAPTAAFGSLSFGSSATNAENPFATSNKPSIFGSSDKKIENPFGSGNTPFGDKSKMPAFKSEPQSKPAFGDSSLKKETTSSLTDSPFGSSTTPKSTGFGSTGFGSNGFKFGSGGFGAFSSNGATESKDSSFGTTAPGVTTSTGASFGSSGFGAFANNGAFGTTAAKESPFGTTAAKESPFGTTASKDSPFGTTASKDSPFGTTASKDSPFGTTASKDSPFGTTASKDSPFGTTASKDSPFGATTSKESPFGTTAAKDSPFGATASKDSPFGATTSKDSPFSTSANAPPFGAFTSQNTNPITINEQAKGPATSFTFSSDTPTANGIFAQSSTANPFGGKSVFGDAMPKLTKEEQFSSDETAKTTEDETEGDKEPGKETKEQTQKLEQELEKSEQELELKEDLEEEIDTEANEEELKESGKVHQKENMELSNDNSASPGLILEDITALKEQGPHLNFADSAEDSEEEIEDVLSVPEDSEDDADSEDDVAAEMEKLNVTLNKVETSDANEEPEPLSASSQSEQPSHFAETVMGSSESESVNDEGKTTSEEWTVIAADTSDKSDEISNENSDTEENVIVDKTPESDKTTIEPSSTQEEPEATETNIDVSETTETTETNIDVSETTEINEINNDVPETAESNVSEQQTNTTESELSAEISEPSEKATEKDSTKNIDADTGTDAEMLKRESEMRNALLAKMKKSSTTKDTANVSETKDTVDASETKDIADESETKDTVDASKTKDIAESLPVRKTKTVTFVTESELGEKSHEPKLLQIQDIETESNEIQENICVDMSVQKNVVTSPKFLTATIATDELEDFQTLAFEGDEAYQSQFYIPKSLPLLVASKSTEYPENIQNIPTVGKEMMKIIYDVEAGFQVLTKNMNNFSQYISDHSNHEIIKHSVKGSLELSNHWRFFEILTIVKAMNKDLKQSDSLLEETNIIYEKSNELHKQSLLAAKDVSIIDSDIAELSRKNNTLQTSMVKKNAPLSFENVQKRKSLRNKINRVKKDYEQLQSSLVILNSQLNPGKLVEDPRRFETVVSSLNRRIYMYVDMINDLKKDIEGLHNKKETVELNAKHLPAADSDVSQMKVSMTEISARLQRKKKLAAVLKGNSVKLDK